MKKVAILVSQNMLPGSDNLREDSFELDEQMGKLVPAFAAKGMVLSIALWNTASTVAAEFDAMLPLNVWDYFENQQDAFLSEMAKVSKLTLLLNSFDTLKWNSHKSYLSELERGGAPTIPTLSVEAVTEASITRAFDMFECDKIVIKPAIGGGAWRQVLHTKNAPMPAKTELPPGEALIQPFMPSVVEDGEYTFLYFGGQFSHAVLKRPKDGDYRVQSIYGGREIAFTPGPEDRNTARAMMDALDFTPLYARVDMIRGFDGGLKLIELEMIEPYLYLPFAEGEGGDNQGAQKLAAAVLKHLEA